MAPLLMVLGLSVLFVLGFVPLADEDDDGGDVAAEEDEDEDEEGGEDCAAANPAAPNAAVAKIKLSLFITSLLLRRMSA